MTREMGNEQAKVAETKRRTRSIRRVRRGMILTNGTRQNVACEHKAATLNAATTAGFLRPILLRTEELVPGAA